MKDIRAEFTAILAHIENVDSPDNTKAYYLKNVRRKGAMIKPCLIVMQNGSSKEFSNVQPGDTVLFQAFVELHDIKLTSPHAKISKKQMINRVNI